MEGPPGWSVVLLSQDSLGIECLRPSEGEPEAVVDAEGWYRAPRADKHFLIQSPPGEQRIVVVLKSTPWGERVYQSLMTPGEQRTRAIDHVARVLTVSKRWERRVFQRRFFVV